MDIPLWAFLLIYLVGVGIFLMVSFFNIYHITKFGFFDFAGKLNTVIFIGWSIAVIVLTGIFLQDTVWDARIALPLPNQIDKSL